MSRDPLSGMTLYTISIMVGQKIQNQAKSLELFGLKVDDFSLKNLDAIKKNAHIVTLNFEIFVEALSDRELKKIINSADLVIADGVFICFLVLILRGKWIKKVSGIDLAKKLLDNSKTIALLGAESDVIEVLKQKFLNKVVFAHHGFYENLFTDEEIFFEIIKSDPEILLVALGSPKQEKLIGKLISQSPKTLDNTIKVGVGGAFDIWSEKLQRAPKWMQNFGFEWLFRIIQEPYRLKRFLYNVYRFFICVSSSYFDEAASY